VDAFNLDESLGYIVRKTSLSFQNWFKRTAKSKGLDITPEQWGALCRLWEEEGQSQRELNDKLPQGITNTSRILDGLEKRQLVIRKTDPNDRRVFRIYLTKKGREIKERLIPIGKEGIEIATKGCSEREIKIVKKILNQICEKLNHSNK